MTYASSPRCDDPLSTAARYGHVPIIRLLLQHGAPVDGVHSTDGYSTLLCRAAERGQYPAAEILLHHGASVNGKIGANIMTQLVTNKEESMIKLLVERAAMLTKAS